MKAYTNPIIPTAHDGHTADPYVLYNDGWYYHCYCGIDGVYLSRAKELCDIGKGEKIKAYDAPQSGNGSEWYAPELHYVFGAWYIYGAPLIDEKTGLHCMSVLERRDRDPFGKYENKGMVCGLENTWCIDGTVMLQDEKYWFIWSSCAEICIAQMQSPWAITGKRMVLTYPEYEFETKQGRVNEGPAVLRRGSKVHVVYSANDSKTDDYCLGLMTYSGGNVLDISNWMKSKTAVFQKTENIFGPGHCSFTTVREEEAEKDYIVYHANLQSGSGWFGRSVWTQEFSWDENDMPVFGKPHR